MRPMTALKKYTRLEATGLWRPDANTQRREVIVSLGEATLTISSVSDGPLTHWSIAAVVRANPDEMPAIYHPHGDSAEHLEFGEDSAELVAALERVQRAIERSRPKRGRLRQVSVAVLLLLFGALLLFWAPDALVNHAVRIVPETKRQEIGAAMLRRVERVAGVACLTEDARAALSKLAQRTGVRQIVVLPAGFSESLHLPGGIVLLNRALIEDHEDPAVAAGFILAERARAKTDDSMARLLRQSGPQAAVRLLTTGSLPNHIIDQAAEGILLDVPPQPSQETMLALFAETGIPSTPYAYAVDVTGESVLSLIEADPFAGQTPRPVLQDRDWVLLQDVCEA